MPFLELGLCMEWKWAVRGARAGARAPGSYAQGGGSFPAFSTVGEDASGQKWWPCEAQAVGKGHVSSGHRVSSPEISRELELSIQHPLGNARLRVLLCRPHGEPRQQPTSPTVQLKGTW